MTDHPTLIPTIRFRETQPLYRNPILLALIPVSLLTTGLLLLGVWYKSGDNALLWTLLCIVAVEATLAAILRVETVVTDEHLTVRFRPFYRRRIAIGEITESEPVRYNPIGDAGGWGIRSSRKFGRVVNAYGDRAVRIVAGKHRILVGSQRPDELAAAIEAAVRAAPPSSRAARQGRAPLTPSQSC